MPADSLLLIAQRAAGRLVQNIDSVGDMPWELVQPIIAKVKNPEQLVSACTPINPFMLTAYQYRIEQSSPQIIGHTSDLWIAFMQKDIPKFSLTQPHRPSDPKNWYKVYRKLKKQADAEVAQGAEKLKAAFASIKQEKEQMLAKTTTRAAVPGRRQNNSGVSRSNWAPSMKGLTASERIRRQVDDTARARMLRERNELKMKKQLKASAYQNPAKVAVAPRSMVEEIKRNEAPPPASIIRAPGRRPSGLTGDERRKVAGASASAPYDLMQDREARLKAMQTRQVGSSALPPRNIGLGQAPVDKGGLSLELLEDDDLFSEDDGNDESEDDIQLPTIPTSSARKTSHMSPLLKPSPGPARLTSPGPRLTGSQTTAGGAGGGGVKRKAPATLFMAPAAKKARPRV